MKLIRQIGYVALLLALPISSALAQSNTTGLQMLPPTQAGTQTACAAGSSSLLTMTDSGVPGTNKSAINCVSNATLSSTGAFSTLSTGYFGNNLTVGGMGSFAGNVGIGTSIPNGIGWTMDSGNTPGPGIPYTSEFTVDSGAGPAIDATFNSLFTSDNTLRTYVAINDTTGRIWGLVVNGSNPGYSFGGLGDFWIDEGGNGPRLLIQKGTGNVGVGTTSPQGNVDIENDNNTASLCLNGSCVKALGAGNILTTIASVNAACVASGDPNPPDYTALQYEVTCGSRFCEANGYVFGIVTEMSTTGGLNNTTPYASTPTEPVNVACAGGLGATGASMGPQGPAGPQGPQGPQGAAGPGLTSSSVVTIGAQGSGWTLNSNGNYYSTSVSSCWANQVAVGGGVYCDASGGNATSIYANYPSGNTGNGPPTSWTGGCVNSGPGAGNGHGAGAYVVCVQQ